MLLWGTADWLLFLWQQGEKLKEIYTSSWADGGGRAQPPRTPGQLGRHATCVLPQPTCTWVIGQERHPLCLWGFHPLFPGLAAPRSHIPNKNGSGSCAVPGFCPCVGMESWAVPGSAASFPRSQAWGWWDHPSTLPSHRHPPKVGVEGVWGHLARFHR